MKLEVEGLGMRLPVMGFLYPEVDGAAAAMTTMVTTGTAKCVFRVPIETLTTSLGFSQDMWHLDRVRLVIESDVTGHITCVRHVMVPSCRWHEDCFDNEELAAACVQARQRPWVRTHRLRRDFQAGLVNPADWSPAGLDPLRMGDRLDFLFMTSWNRMQVGPYLAQVTMELTLRRYHQVAP